MGLRTAWLRQTSPERATMAKKKLRRPRSREMGKSSPPGERNSAQQSSLSVPPGVSQVVVSVHGAIVQIEKEKGALRGALRDLLGYYDRLQDGRDHGGWTHADGARIAEIRQLAK